MFLDTEDGDPRQEERRDIIRRKNEERRQSDFDPGLDKRKSIRRSEVRRNLENERRHGTN